MGDYCTVADVRKYARGIVAATVSDADVEVFITGAEGEINDALNQDFLQHTDEVEYYSGTGRPRLFINADKRPILAITHIKDRDADGLGQTTLTVFTPVDGEGDYYPIDAEAGIIKFYDNTPRAANLNIEVKYNWGYVTVPASVAKLCALIASIPTMAMAAGVASPQGLTSISEGALSLSWGGGPFQETVAQNKAEADALLRKIGRRTSFGSAESKPL